jgi:hypothetical protein
MTGPSSPPAHAETLRRIAKFCGPHEDGLRSHAACLAGAAALDDLAPLREERDRLTTASGDCHDVLKSLRARVAQLEHAGQSTSKGTHGATGGAPIAPSEGRRRLVAERPQRPADRPSDPGPRRQADERQPDCRAARAQLSHRQEDAVPAQRGEVGHEDRRGRPDVLESDVDGDDPREDLDAALDADEPDYAADIARGHRIARSAEKRPPSAGSWWLDKSREELNEQAHARSDAMGKTRIGQNVKGVVNTP